MKEIAHAIQRIAEKWRQVGHTEAVIRGAIAADRPVTIVAANYHAASLIRSRLKERQASSLVYVVTLDGIDKLMESRVPQPVLFDLEAVRVLAQAIKNRDDEIERLVKCLDSLEAIDTESRGKVSEAIALLKGLAVHG